MRLNTATILEVGWGVQVKQSLIKIIIKVISMINWSFININWYLIKCQITFLVNERKISSFKKRIFRSVQAEDKEPKITKVARKCSNGFRPLLSGSTTTLVSTTTTLLESERVVSNEQNCTDPSLKCTGTWNIFQSFKHVSYKCEFYM